MKRILVWATVLVVILALSLTATREVGHANPSPGMQIMAANECDPRPCWQNIRPGQTTLDQAEQQLRDSDAALSLVSRSGEMCWNSLAAPFWRMCAYADARNTAIQRVVMQLPSDGLLFGDAVTLFGKPVAMEMCAVVNSTLSNLPRRFLATFITFEDNVWIMAYNPADPEARRFDPEMLVLRMVFSANSTMTGTIPTRWHGFSALTRQQGACRPE